MLWALYTAAVNKTKAAGVCNDLASNEEAWSDMIVLLITSHLRVEHEDESPWFSKPLWVSFIASLLGGLLTAWPWIYHALINLWTGGSVTSDPEFIVFRKSGRRPVMYMFLGIALVLSAAC